MRRTLAALLLLAAAAAHAAVPQRINYQGKLGNAAGDPLSGTYSFRFKLFVAETGGAAIFSEDVTGANAVSVVNGIYTVQIGSFTPGGIPYGVFEGQDLYLEVDVNAGSNLTGAETLTPRERLNSAAWAIHALGAERLGAGAVIATFTATGNFQLVSGSTLTSDGTLTFSTATSAALTGAPALFFNRSGNAGMGTAAPGITLPSGWGGGGGSRILELRGSSGGTDDGGLFVRRADGVLGYDFWYDNTDGAVYLDQRFPGGAAKAFGFRSQTNGTPAEYLTIRGDGLIGVSTASPATTLDVNGNASFGLGANKSTFTATPSGTVYALRTSSGITVANAGGVVAAFFEGTHVGDGSRLTGIAAGENNTYASSKTFTADVLVANRAMLTASSATITYGVTAGTLSVTGSITAASGTFTQNTFDTVLSSGNVVVNFTPTDYATDGAVRMSGLQLYSDRGFGVDLHYGQGGAQSAAFATALYGRTGSSNWLRFGAYPSGSTAQSAFIEGMTLASSGHLGVGAVTPSARLHVSSGTTGATNNLVLVTTGATNLFRVQANGNVYALGAFTGGGADLAEMYLSRPEVEAAEIVALGADGRVERATRGGGPVLGIVSSSPGSVLGWTSQDSNMPDHRPVALSGRVPLKVTDENGPVRRGDRLGLSRRHPGWAAKASAGETSVGFALEDFAGGEGRVLCFVRTLEASHRGEMDVLLRENRELRRALDDIREDMKRR